MAAEPVHVCENGHVDDGHMEMPRFGESDEGPTGRCSRCGGRTRRYPGIDALAQALVRAREELWLCYLASGADPDGDDGTHLNEGETIREVRELRDSYDEAIGVETVDWSKLNRRGERSET